MSSRPPAAADDETARLKTLLPGWHVWHVFTPLDRRGRYCWCAMPEGAGKSAVTSYDADALVASAQEFQLGLAGHIARTKRELADTAERDQGRRRMLAADIAAYERLAERCQA